MKVDKPCILCNSRSINVLKWGATSLYHCQHCDAYFNADMPSEAELQEYYTESYRLVENSVDSEAEFRRVCRLPEQFSLIREIEQFQPAPAKILDMGCDKGFFLDEARRFGYTVQGVELSEEGRRYCTKIGIPTKKSVDELSDMYDIITLWHVLEHFTNPKQVLRSLQKYLSDGGIIVLRVPDFDSSASKKLKEKWVWFQPHHHYVHYTPTSLQSLFQCLGFEVLLCRSQNTETSLTNKSWNLANSIFQEVQNNPVRDKLISRGKRFAKGLMSQEIILIAKKKMEGK